MKLIKTRKMLSIFKLRYIDEDKGSTITDTDFKDVVNELNQIENKYIIYKRLSFVLIYIISFLFGFIYFLI